ncbi:MAG: KpsF/GutQ family sugar-phosphate isomerase [Gemmatimonadaceae bacterium]|nr:KpsF/GutQ family sugar-phosphate isomerase [Gemmatimonadaceae bacterium]MCW5825132.1 KpsF/GutQ family sugar-phosphate isomerase [Gemmatimonadaceae bacterium]
MSESARIVARGKRVLELERDAVGEAAARLDDAFAEAVRLIQQAKGRVIVAGIGKSGLIARKIAATMTSTGTPAYFLHPTESVHGDLGIVSDQDVAVLLSKSGETQELLPLLEQLTRLGVPCIAITGNRESTLARNSRVALDGFVREEACPHDLAPTTSTTLALALGDALAVALLEEKGFRREDFAKFHPGGALGRKLLLRVRDVMVPEPLPTLDADATMRAAIVVLAKQRGLAVVLEGDGQLAGLLTTGDLTRLMQRDGDVMGIRVGDVMTRRPHTVDADALGSAAVHTMEQFGVIALPALDADGRVVGIVHLHDLMRAGAA